MRSTSLFGLIVASTLSVFSAFGESISGTVDLNGEDVSYDGLTGSGKLCNTSEKLSTVTLTLASECEFAGTIEGNIRLVVKAGSTAQVLDSVNTYAGGTEIQSGQLALDGGTPGTGAVKLSNDGKLTFRTVTAGKNDVLANDFEIVGSGKLGFWRSNGAQNGTVQLTGCLTAKDATLRFENGGWVTLAQPLSSDRVDGLALYADYVQLNVTSNFFGTGESLVNVSVEVSEGNVGAPSKITLNGPQELPERIVVTGGSIVCANTVQGGVTDSAAGALERPFARPAIVFNGSLKTDVDLEFKGGVFSLPSGARQVSFDVRSGKTVTLSGALQASADGSKKGFVKAGGGLLKITGAIGAEGTVDVKAGVLEFAREAYLTTAAKTVVAPGASVRLADGVRTALTPKADIESFLSSANVWFDATKLGKADGENVSSAANLGTVGGTFSLMPSGSGTPVCSANGINGRAAVKFNGSQGLRLDTYANTTNEMTVFVVFKWDSWATGDGNGQWSGPLTLGTRFDSDPNYAEERFNPGTFGISFGGPTFSTFSRYYDCTISGGSRSAQSYSVSHGASVGNAMLLADRRKGDRFEDVVSWAGADGVSSQTTVQDLPGASAQNVDTVGIGCRMYMTGGVVARRGLIGKVGEVIAFSRALSDDERDAVESYLKNKWLVEGVEPVPTAGAVEASLAVESPSGAAEVRFGPSDPFAVSKSGAGDLTLVGQVSAATKVSSTAGGLQVRGTDNSSRAAVWVDASDADSIVFSGANKIMRVMNKGYAGGWFGHCGALADYTPDGINGHPSFVFGGSQSSVLWMTNAMAWAQTPGRPRSLHIYGVFRRDAFSAWGTPFTFFASNQGALGDQQIPGSFHWEEGEVGKYALNFGTDSDIHGPDSGVYRDNFYKDIADGTPYLFVTHQSDTMFVAAFETAADADKTAITWLGRDGCRLTPFNVDRFELGGRMAAGIPTYQTWKGAIAELIVFDRQLTQSEETELISYLRTKWFSAGADLPVAPLCLRSGEGADGFSSAAELVLSDTTFVDSLPAQTIGTLSVADSELRRAGDAAKFFDVLGAATFGGAITVAPLAYPSGVTKLITYGSTTDSATWSLPVGARRNTIIENRPSESAVVLEHSQGMLMLIR